MLEAIFQGIDEKVKLEIDKIQEEQEEAVLILSRDYDKEREQKYQKTKDTLLRRSEREMTEAQKKLELRGRFEIQRTKRQILEEVYQAALLKINKADEDDFRKSVEKIVEALPIKLVGKAKAGKRTAPILRALLSGRQLTVDDDLAEEGFVVITANLEIDLRFSQILNQNREKTDPEALKILFS